MKATEVFVEQVIIGAIALLIAALPFAPELAEIWAEHGDDLGTVLQATALALMVGAAYLLGIVFDRFIDTVLQRLDGHNRLRFALSKVKKVPARWKDPFPEGDYRQAALELGGAVAEWVNYLRSRIRLSRALAALLPGLTVSGVLAAAGPEPWLAHDEAPVLGGFYAVVAVGAVYLVTFVVVVASAESLRAAPRTDSPEAVGYGLDRGYFPEEMKQKVGEQRNEEAEEKKLRGERRRTLLLDLAVEPAIWGAAVLVAGSFWLGAFLGFDRSPRWAIPFVGTALTALSGWSWWRISQTYWKFLRRASRHREKGGAARAAR